VTFALARSLLLADAVTPAALAEALFLSATRGTSLVRTLLAARAIDTLRLEQVLERGEAPYMRHIAPVTALVDRLPPGLCDRLLAIPVRSDPRTGTVDIAVVDARDPHPAEELTYWLKAPVRVVRTSIATMEAALLRIVARVEAEPEPDLGMRSLAPPIWAPSPSPVPPAFLRTPLYGSSAFDAAAANLEPPAEDPDIAIPLTRRNASVVGHRIVDVGAEVAAGVGLPAAERDGHAGPARGDAEPVLDLKRRKARSTLPLPELLGPASGVLASTGAVSTGAVASSAVASSAVASSAAASGVASSKSASSLAGGLPSASAPSARAGSAPAASSREAPASSGREAPPSTAPRPTAPATPGALGSVLDRMLQTQSRDEIFDLLVAGTRAVARRAGVLAVRRDALTGWTASRELAERQALRGVRLPNAMKTVFHEAFDREGAVMTRIPSDVAHAPLVAVMRSPPSGEVAVAGVVAEGKPIAVLFADGILEAAPALERLGVLSRTAGEALARLLRERREKSA
jgi:hypothetical protein